MTSYKTFPEVLSAANAGQLNLTDWLEYETLVGKVNNGTANYVTLDRAKQLLSVLQQTEPNDKVTKFISDGINSGLMFLNDSKEVIQPQMPGQSIFGNVTDFLNTLGQKNTWTRVAEFAIGTILVAIGANALLKSGGGK